MAAERARYNNGVYKSQENFDSSANNVPTLSIDVQRSDTIACQRRGIVCNENGACYCVKTPYCGLLNSYARETVKSVGVPQRMKPYSDRIVDKDQATHHLEKGNKNNE